MRKRILSMLCVFALCFTLLPVSALADDVSDWETTQPTTSGGWTATDNYDTSWFDGQNVPGGTQADPYIISDAADLAGLSVIVNGLSTYENKAYSFKDKYIKIADNVTIDLADHQWTPIGTKSNVYGGDIPEPDGPPAPPPLLPGLRGTLTSTMFPSRICALQTLTATLWACSGMRWKLSLRM